MTGATRMERVRKERPVNLRVWAGKGNDDGSFLAATGVRDLN
jgi:hypothetical protein